MPLTTEEVWRGLTGERSVHLTDWPLVEDLPADDALVASMDAVRDVCSAGSALRKTANLRNRLPLSQLTVVSDADLAGFESLIADELNLKAVSLLALSTAEDRGFMLMRKVVVNARAAGPRLGKQVQDAIKGARENDVNWHAEDPNGVEVNGIQLLENEFTVEEVLTWESHEEAPAAQTLPRGGFVVLDTTVTPELEAEGTARDLIRAVQQARKDAGLQVSDRIALTLSAPAATLEAARTHEALIAEETLATSVTYADAETVAVEVTKA